MARTHTHMDATAGEIWAVLADGPSYARWVVGAKEIRAVEPGWPQPGSRLHHTVGAGPMTLEDNTKSLTAQAPRLLVLEARGRPLGRARITFTLTPAGTGTDVEIDEQVVSPAALRPMNPVFAPAIRVRNKETLRRLADEVRASQPT
jgi:hypothetical protein